MAKIKMAARRFPTGCQSWKTTKKVRDDTGAQVKGRQTKDGLEISLAIVAILKFTIWFCFVSDFHSFSLTG